MKVGDSIWVYESRDRRVSPGHDGWSERSIIGETRVSWIVAPSWYEPGTPPTASDLERGEKIKKKDLADGSLATMKTSRQEVDDGIFVGQHGWSIGEAVERCRDASKLRQIAEILGYDPTRSR